MTTTEYKVLINLLHGYRLNPWPALFDQLTITGETFYYIKK